MHVSLVEATLNRLSRVFHKEADFQQALAWNLHEHFPSLSIQAEYPANGGSVDLWIVDETESVAIELKYQKKRFEAQTDGETFKYGNDPTDIACYGYIADIEELETLVNEEYCERGIAIMLSNDALLWDNEQSGANYDEFKLSDGRILSGQHSWHPDASTSDTYSRPLQLTNEYTLTWEDYDYSYPQERDGNTTFKYLITEIS